MRSTLPPFLTALFLVACAHQAPVVEARPAYVATDSAQARRDQEARDQSIREAQEAHARANPPECAASVLTAASVQKMQADVSARIARVVEDAKRRDEHLEAVSKAVQVTRRGASLSDADLKEFRESIDVLRGQQLMAQSLAYMQQALMDAYDAIDMLGDLYDNPDLHADVREQCLTVVEASRAIDQAEENSETQYALAMAFLSLYEFKAN